MVEKIVDFWRAREIPLLVIGILLIAITLWLVVEALLRWRRGVGTVEP